MAWGGAGARGRPARIRLLMAALFAGLVAAARAARGARTVATLVLIAAACAPGAGPLPVGAVAVLGSAGVTPALFTVATERVTLTAVLCAVGLAAWQFRQGLSLHGHESHRPLLRSRQRLHERSAMSHEAAEDSPGGALGGTRRASRFLTMARLTSRSSMWRLGEAIAGARSLPKVPRYTRPRMCSAAGRRGAAGPSRGYLASRSLSASTMSVGASSAMKWLHETVECRRSGAHAPHRAAAS